MASDFVRRGSRAFLACVCLCAVGASCDVPNLDNWEMPEPDLVPHTLLGTFKGTVTDTAEGSCYDDSTKATTPYNISESFAMLIGIRDDGRPTGLMLSEGITGAMRMPVTDLWAVDEGWDYQIPISTISLRTYTIGVNEASFSLTGFHFEYRMEGVDTGTAIGVETGGTVWQGPGVSNEYGITITVDGELSGNTLKYSESAVRDDIYKVEGEYVGHCTRTVTSSGTLTKQ